MRPWRLQKVSELGHTVQEGRLCLLGQEVRAGGGAGVGGLAGIHASLLAGQTAQVAVTSASVTTLFLNRRSSSSSDEHLGLRSRKALGPGTHPAPHPMASLMLGWK